MSQSISAQDSAADLPAKSLVASRYIFRERDVGVAVDGDVVVVVEGNQLAKSPVTSKRAGLVGNALHHAAVAEDAVPAPF